jgi:hypothetical protein
MDEVYWDAVYCEKGQWFWKAPNKRRKPFDTWEHAVHAIEKERNILYMYPTDETEQLIEQRTIGTAIKLLKQYINNGQIYMAGQVICIDNDVAKQLVTQGRARYE